MRTWPLLMLVGCASSYGPDDYLRDLGAMHCQRMLDCCTDAEYQDWWTPDSGSNMQSCTQVWEHPPHGPQILDGINRGTIQFDTKAAHACVDALAALACTDFEPAYRFRETYCDSPFHGTLAIGDTCRVDEECASRYCELGGMPTGTCHARVDVGQACTYDGGGGDACQVEDACIGATCEPGYAAGTACTADFQCADDWCKGASQGSGQCLRACDGR